MLERSEKQEETVKKLGPGRKIGLAISFGSINTGLPKDIVQQIMKAERIPLEKMEMRKGKIDERKRLVDQLGSLVTQMRKSLSENSNYRSLKELSFQTNDDVLGVKVDKNVAHPSTYQIEVVRMPQKSSAMTSGFSDRVKSYTGVGFIRYNLPDGQHREIYVDSENANLDGIANLINGDSRSGLQASVVNDGSGSENPWRIILSLKETGDGKRAEFPNFYFVDGVQDLYLEFEREAHDGLVKLDGFEIEVPNTTIKDVIPGVVLDLKKAIPNEEFSLTISEDKKQITDKISTIVDAINGVLGFIREQNNMDENTDTSRTLGGDILIQSIESRLRSAIFKPIATSNGPKRLGEMGIKFQKSGLLELDKEKFEIYLSENHKTGVEILVGSMSVDGKRTKGAINNILQEVEQILSFPNGMINSRKNSLQGRIGQIDRQIESKERMIEQKERNIKDKFARLEETIAQIKTQGAGLASLGVQVNSITPQLG